MTDSEKMEPTRVKPRIDSADPIRPKLLRESEEPM